MAMCLMWRDVQSAGVAPAEPISVNSRLCVAVCMRDQRA